jgi:sugar (pentulose or hexulose) kinase
MATELLAGVDVGTTLCKAALVTPEGTEVAHGGAPTPWRVVPGGAEVDPDAIVDTALAAVAQALARGPDGPVVGVGVTSMAETAVLLDAGGSVVAPSIAWHDMRGAPEARRLAEDLGGTRFTDHTGLPVSQLCTLVKYRWLRHHHPAAAVGTRLLSVAEWVVHRLGGEQVAELSLASRTGALELATRDWWPEALAWAQAPPGLLPPLLPAGAPAGRVRRDRAVPDRLAGAVLTVAGHDHLCAAVGAGAVATGEVFDSCGTAEALVRAVPPPVPASGIRQAVAEQVTVGWHVVPDLQALLGGQRAGLAFQRFLQLLGVEPAGLAALEEAALLVPPDAGGLQVIDPGAEQASLIGIGRDPSPAAVWRATVEAVSDRTAAMLRTIEAVGGPVVRVVVAGGWARSPTLRQAKAARLPRPSYAAVTEAGARGAALLAGCAAGLYGGPTAVPPPPAEA